MRELAFSGPTDSTPVEARQQNEIVCVCSNLGLEVVLGLEVLSVDSEREILGHLAGLDGLDADALEVERELLEGGVAVELSAVVQAARPREDRRDGVGGGLAALLVLAPVAGDRAVGGLGLDRLSVGRDQHGGHQAERSVSLRDDIGLHISIIVLARPDEAAAGLERLRHLVVDQSVLVLDAQLVELLLVRVGELLLEDVLEQTVVLLQNSVLGRKVQRLEKWGKEKKKRKESEKGDGQECQ